MNDKLGEFELNKVYCMDCLEGLKKIPDNKNIVIIDPYAGSGTTLLAAKQLGRKFIGFEINPEYVKIANKRLAQEVLT